MNWTAFKNDRLLASGPAAEVAIAVRKAMDEARNVDIQIFDDHTGRLVDFDPRGTDAEIVARLSSPQDSSENAVHQSVGRPKLGVVAREVTLLPRHWDWLAAQPASASATIRGLIERARSQDAGKSRALSAQAAADRFMMAKLGDHPGYEEASRALFAKDQHRFNECSQPWPKDLRQHARRLAAGAFE